MATVGEIVASALWLLRVVDPEESPEASHYERCIEILNRSMARIEGNRSPLGWAAVKSPDDTLPVEAKHEDLVIHILAVAARPVYGATLDSDVAQRYRELMSDLHRDMAIDSPIQSNHSLPEPDASVGGCAIISGSGWV